MGFSGGLVDMWSSGHVCGRKTGVAHLGTCGQVDVDQWPGGHGRVAMWTWTCGRVDQELWHYRCQVYVDVWPCGRGLVDVIMWTGDQESDVAMALYRLMDHPVLSRLVGCGRRWRATATATDIDDGHSINLYM